MATFRIDAGSHKKPIRRDNGTLVASATISRCGVFLYRQPDGSVRRELRPPEEVFAAESLASFSMVPVTLNHPSGPINSRNAKSLSVGAVGENVHQDGDLVCTTIVVHDATAVKAVEAGKTALSCGYSCDLDSTPGTWRGQPYDAIQKNIRGDHLAIVDVARAGPEARIRLDGAGEMICNDTISDIEDQMSDETKSEKAIEPEVKADAAPESKPVNEPKSQVTAAAVIEAPPAPITPDYQAECVKQTARADAAEAECARQKAQVAELVTALAAANAPSRIQSLVSARFALESRAKSLAPSVKCDGMSDAEIKLAVIDARDPEFSKHQRRNDSVYIEARFDLLAPETKVQPEVVRVDSIPAPVDYRAEYLKAVLEANKPQ